VNELERIVARTRKGLGRRRKQVPPDELEGLAAARHARSDRRSLREALSRPGVGLIAEHKRRSPSAGLIRADLALTDVVGAYERGGAAALSVLTEEASFDGSLEDLRTARDAAGLPILRKDFIVDSYQVLEAYAAGADAILLIVAALSEPELAQLHARAQEFGLDALVEVHDARELERAAALGAELIGINNRDLTTLTVDRRRTFELLPAVPPRAVVVAESGYSRREQLAELLAAGVHGVLIGEALMRAADIEAACQELTASAGSGARAGRAVGL
jgi:indole-3-glycerol phosphate synthase